jgi:Fic family protein
MRSDRAGRYVRCLEGYDAYVPKKLPPNPAINLDANLIELLSSADRKLGRLDGVAEVLPNPDLFVAMYVKKEALLSSQIEGTQASLIDVLGAAKDKSGKTSDAQEVVNYVAAMNYALERIVDLPISLRLIKETHSVLLQSGRGSKKTPGEFRTSQNWIGHTGQAMKDAAFVPPTVENMNIALADMEEYLYEKSGLPPLIKAALLHAQFETIHPFLDGNGRIGRLLITFWLCHQGVLSRPLLYLSHFFKENRAEYYERLMGIRFKGDWEGWIRFFLKGIILVSEEAVTSARNIITLKEHGQQMISTIIKNNGNHLRLFEDLFQNPLITRSDVACLLDVSAPTASSIVNSLVQYGILQDLTPNQTRNKEFLFRGYLDILSRGTEID